MDKHIKKCYGSNANFAVSGENATLTIAGGSIKVNFADGNYHLKDIESMFAANATPAKIQNTFILAADGRKDKSREIIFASGIFNVLGEFYEAWQN